MFKVFKERNSIPSFFNLSFRLISMWKCLEPNSYILCCLPCFKVKKPSYKILNYVLIGINSRLKERHWLSLTSVFLMSKIVSQWHKLITGLQPKFTMLMVYFIYIKNIQTLWSWTPILRLLIIDYLIVLGNCYVIFTFG